jgi:hypothetical protein
VLVVTAEAEIERERFLRDDRGEEREVLLVVVEVVCDSELVVMRLRVAGLGVEWLELL